MKFMILHEAEREEGVVKKHVKDNQDDVQEERQDILEVKKHVKENLNSHIYLEVEG